MIYRHRVTAVLGVCLLLAAVTAPSADDKPDDKGFAFLFNGKNLDGWEGATNGYAAQDGVLVCLKGKGGNLYTAKEYGNFILRLEFLLDKGGNNGVGLRYDPSGKDGAFDAGMEIQILDDDAPQYKNIQPYQHCGSLYGVAAAEPGHTKPAGEWNSYEITANGNHIVVKLNGATVVDTDIQKASQPETADHRPHPGLLHKTGRIAFLGHGHEVKFRNIRLKELPASDSASK